MQTSIKFTFDDLLSALGSRLFPVLKMSPGPEIESYDIWLIELFVSKLKM